MRQFLFLASVVMLLISGYSVAVADAASSCDGIVYPNQTLGCTPTNCTAGCYIYNGPPAAIPGGPPWVLHGGNAVETCLCWGSNPGAALVCTAYIEWNNNTAPPTYVGTYCYNWQACPVNTDCGGHTLPGGNVLCWCQ